MRSPNEHLVLQTDRAKKLSNVEKMYNNNKQRIAIKAIISFFVWCVMKNKANNRRGQICIKNTLKLCLNSRFSRNGKWAQLL